MRQVISLGGDCQVAHHIRRVFEDRDKHFFDWLIVPAATVHRLIEDQFRAFLETPDLVPEFNEDRLTCVKDTRNNTLFMHDFQGFDQENIRAVQAKYRYLADKLLASLDDGVPKSFVRKWHPIDHDNKDAAARALCEAIRSHNPEHRLVFMHEDQDCPDIIESNYQRVFARQVPGDWVGPADRWDEILAGGTHRHAAA